MEYLLMMTASGSTMTACCWILRRLLRGKISANYYYLLAKAAILYYLIPLPFLKRWYGEAIRIIVPERQMAMVKMEIAQIPLTRTKYIVRADGKTYVNNYMELQIILVFLWLTVACLLMLRELRKYIRTARLVAGYVDTTMTEEHEAFLAGLKEQYGTKRRVLLYQGESGRPSITFGVLRPVILCGREIGSRESELVVRHEMVHIRRLDAVWKILIQFAKFLHWCNPMMWLLCDEFDRVCEISCDETAVWELTEEERTGYGLLLIEEAQEAEELKRFPLKWKAGFGSNMRRVKERVDNLMRKKKWNRFATGTLVAALIFANSMTAFAYKDGYNEIASEDMPEETLEKVLESDTVLFAPEDTGEEIIIDFEDESVEILYDRQFVDEEGNIYYIPDAESHRSCDHDYEPGTEYRHNSNSNGSCEVMKFKAERCKKCGTVKIGDFISSTYYAKCPH